MKDFFDYKRDELEAFLVKERISDWDGVAVTIENGMSEQPAGKVVVCLRTKGATHVRVNLADLLEVASSRGAKVKPEPTFHDDEPGYDH